LVYSSILAWSNGWFFLVACEIIAVGPIRYHLPGIGSFLARAADQNQPHLIFWGLASLATLIVALDFLFWRPTSDWAERFKYENNSTSSPTFIGEHVSIPLFVLSHVSPIFEPTSRLLRALFFPFMWVFKEVLLPLIWDLPVSIFTAIWNTIYGDFLLRFRQKWFEMHRKVTWLKNLLSWGLALSIIAWGFFLLAHWFRPPWPPIAHDIPKAILQSTKRLLIALSISLAWVLPLTLYSWDKPRLRRWLTTFAQVGASLPAIALFPLFIIVVIKKFGGGMELASILLLLAGMQWYPLFNCLGGVSVIPSELSEATQTLGLSRWKIWQKLTLPAIRPAQPIGLPTC
jgi:NitT/TauT family transport system permease protein